MALLEDQKMDSTRRTTQLQEQDSINDKPNQPASYKFPKQKFGEAKPVLRSVQSAWFHKWPWLHYYQADDRMFCHTCCLAVKQGMTIHGVDKKQDTFITVGYTNWKDAAGEKKGG